MTTPALTPKSPELSLPRTQNAPSPAGTAPLKERVHDALEAIGRVFKVQRNIVPATPSELKQGVQLRENAVQALDRLRDGLGELGNQRPELLKNLNNRQIALVKAANEFVLDQRDAKPLTDAAYTELGRSRGIIAGLTSDKAWENIGQAALGREMWAKMSVGVRGSLLDAALQSISDTVPNGAKSGPHELSQRQRATIKLLNEVFARDIKENIEGYRSIPEGLLKTVTKSPFWELAHGTEIGVAIWNGPSISLNHRRTMIESWALNIPSRLPTSENRYEAKHSPEQNDFKQLKTPQVERREIEDPKRDIALKVAHALAASNPSLGTLGTLGKKDDLVTVMGALIDDSIWNQLRGLSYAKEMWACVSTAEARRVSITEGLRSISRELPAGSESGPTVFNERKRAAIKTVNAVFNQNYPETAE